MAADNVDIFKKIVFSIPSSRVNAAAIALTGLLYGAFFYASLKMFAGNLVNTSMMGPVWILMLGLLLFILPALISGELLYLFLPDYPRNWGYFLALVGQLVFFVDSLILSGANSFINAWNLLWLGVIAVYLSNFFILLLTLGDRYWKRIGVLSLVQPLSILAGFHVLLGNSLRIPVELYASNLTLLPFAGILLLGILAMSEYLLKTNVSSVSVLGLTSALLQKQQEALDLGYPTEVDTQTLRIRNQREEATIAVPWVHPGPLEGFGGGRLTSRIIEALNKDGEGFFFHVPSTHKSDPANPRDYRKILDALSEPEMEGKASRLLKKSYGELTLYGRRINGKKIVFMETDRYDDFELSVFREIIDPEEVLLVDLHNHERDSETDGELWYNTTDAHRYRKYLREFLGELEKEELHDYSAGFSARNTDKPVFALVEDAGDQRTLIFGIEGNEVSKELLELKERYQEEYDEVTVFSTDTHQSIHQLSSSRQVDPSEMIESIETAEEQVSTASIGFSNRRTEEMVLLQEDYHSLIFSINILVRFLPLALLIIYIALAIWVF